MHTVTFYSFKGGVGRTLALVNIGVELANTGRKVLLVDFDLEAPGIDTFSPLSPPNPTMGVVDYVTSYLQTDEPPELGEYVYKVDGSDKVTGDLWVMPAGLRDGSYGAKLSQIDWQDLYARRNGFLLLEDLKLKWESDLKPDYVLIDSRTGHTEVGGICTRQLPDTVVSLFIPNQQNLEGLGFVVDAIHRQNKSSNKQINLEFAASNVPDLDDEHQILYRMMRRFRMRLRGHGPSSTRVMFTTINRYDSLHLLDQSIFLIDRPKSRLAKQYRTLLKRVISHNLDDREAALRALTEGFPRGGRLERLGAGDFEGGLSSSEEDKIQTILAKHSDDPEINFLTGQLLRSRGELDEADERFARAYELAKDTADPQLEKYQMELVSANLHRGNVEESHRHLEDLLQSRSIQEMDRLIALLGRFTDKPNPDWLDRPVFADRPEEQLDELVWQVCESRAWQGFFVDLFNRLEPATGRAPLFKFTSLTLAAIGSGKWKQVLAEQSTGDVLQNAAIDRCFNYGMAKWARDSVPDKQVFQRVIELHEQDPGRIGLNLLQCLSVCEFNIGNAEAAVKQLDRCRHFEREFVFSEFSCWSYLRLDREKFGEDIEEMERFVNGEPILPRFIREAADTGTKASP